MQKVNCLLLFCLLLIAERLPAQAQQLPLTSGRLSSGNALIELPDASLVISKFFQSGTGPLGNGSLNVTRVSLDNGPIWSKDYLFEQAGNRSTVRHWPSEDALLLGASLTSGFPYKVVSRLGLDGNVVWSRRFGSLTDFNNINLGLIDLVAEDDGTAVIAGGAQELANTNDANDLYVARIDANGEVLWANNYCFSCLGRDAIFSDLLATRDGGYLITGGVNGTAQNTGNTYLLLMKVDANGNLEWCNQYQSAAVVFAFTQVGRETVELPNGNFVVAGFLDDFPASIRDGLLLEVNPGGQFQRAVQVNIAGSSHEVAFNNLVALDDNTLVVPGSSEEDVNISVAKVNNFLLQIQLDGTIDWSYNYFQEDLLGFGTPRNDLIRLQDNRFGYLANDHQGFDELYPVLIIAYDNGQTGCEEPIALTTDPTVTYTATPLSPVVQPNLEAAGYGVAVNTFNGYAIDPLPRLELGPDTAFCQDFTLSLDATVNFPAAYNWNTGQTSPGIVVDEPGSYQVTVTATSRCLQLTDSLLIEQLEGPSQSLDTILCEGQSITIGGITYDSTGVYAAVSPGPDCDTLVSLTLAVLPGAVTALDTLLCPGTALTLGGQTYTDPGTYVETFTTENGCDSTVNITLGFFPPPPALIRAGTVNCADQTVNLTAAAGSNWQWSNGATSNSITVPAPGTYSLTLSDTNGCLQQDTLVLSPIDDELLELELAGQSDYAGFGVSCAGATDGELSVVASGGQPPYTYRWNNGSTEAGLSGLAAGTYSVTATDPNGCRGTESLQVVAPLPIEFSLDSAVSGCAGFESGSIEIINLSGGAGAFEYALNQELPQGSPLFTGLAPGTYAITVRDINDCEGVQSVTLPEPISPFLNLGVDTTIRLGESFQIRGQTNLAAITQIDWAPESGLDCTNCLDPVAAPLETTTYQLALTDSSGCVVMSSIQIRILPDRAVFVPNAFSPNGDGVNDRFLPYPGPAVERINRMQVFDRWGALVYESGGLAPGNPDVGWDGEVAGQPAAVGAYVYMVQVRFLDGVEKVISGDLSLVR
ncbi:MAG: gliding motility-associated C-terminal domain-containing protein [Lewinellaceae bacterium]|nr:gliding motility-associated C-terminal domain-containing protein [Lewinellaceae bacterium]